MLSPAFLQLAKRLIGADTVSANGTKQAADLLQPLWEHAGLPVQRQVVREDGVEHVNVLAGPGGVDTAAPGGVLFVTHLDTVPPGPAGRWTETSGDPWNLTAKDGWLFGLGVADVKLDSLCKAEAARRLQGTALRRPFWLLGTFGEEVGLRGARHFAQSELFGSMRPRFVLCGEPSELKLIHAHKGYAVVKVVVRDRKARLVATQGRGVETLEFHGKAAHSSTPHLGVNAIGRALAWVKASGAPVLSARGGTSNNVVPGLCALEVPAPGEDGRPPPDARAAGPAQPPRPNLWRALATASALEELWQELLRGLSPHADARFDPAGAVGGLNLLSSPATHLPFAPDAVFGVAEVTLQLDARLLPQHDPDRLVADFRARAQAWADQLSGGEVSLDLSVERNASGMALPDDAELVRRCGAALGRLGLDPAPRAKPTSTEAGVFARLGCEAVVIGPGVSTGNAHTANERIEMAQLEKACDLYEALILELCS